MLTPTSYNFHNTACISPSWPVSEHDMGLVCMRESVHHNLKRHWLVSKRHLLGFLGLLFGSQFEAQDAFGPEQDSSQIGQDTSSQSYLKYRKSVWAEQEQLSYWERTLSTRSCSELVRSVQNLTVQSSSGTYLVYFTRRWRRPSSHFEAGFAACGYSTSLFCISRHTTQGNFGPQETRNISNSWHPRSKGHDSHLNHQCRDGTCVTQVKVCTRAPLAIINVHTIETNEHTPI